MVCIPIDLLIYRNSISEETDIRSISDTLETNILNTSDINEEKTVNLEDLMSTTINLIENGYKNGGKLLGTATGYNLIDNL